MSKALKSMLVIVVVSILSVAVVPLAQRLPWNDPGATFAKHAARAASSVFMVLIVDDRGYEHPVGTAFAVGTGVAATNAHIAAGFEELNAGDSMVLRTAEPEVRDFQVSRAEVHPGSEAFDKVWDSYRPARQIGADRFALIDSAGSACDVALLHTREVAGFPEALPLARPEMLAKLRIGEEIALIGHPMEAMPLVNTRAPVPYVVFGRVLRLTDFLGVAQPERAGAAEAELVYHDANATGGSSGSPILNAEGYVIAIQSGGVLLGYGRWGRLWGFVDFAQRVDLLEELLDGTAESADARRARRWQADLRQVYDSMSTGEEASGWSE